MKEKYEKYEKYDRKEKYLKEMCPFSYVRARVVLTSIIMPSSGEIYKQNGAVAGLAI